MKSNSSNLLRTVSASQEQAWNSAQLKNLVTEPKIAFWQYRNPGVVFGCSQRLDTLARCMAQLHGHDLVRRRAGGGVVLVGPWMLGLSIVLPPSHPLARLSSAQSYRWVGEAHASVFQEMGLQAKAISPGELRSTGASVFEEGLEWACFGGLSPWELVVGKRKLTGLAQVRGNKGTLIVGGTLMSDPDWNLLSRATGNSREHAEKLHQHTTSFERETGRKITAEELSSKLAETLERATNIETSWPQRLSSLAV